jgi:hypothetical protein
MAFLATMSCQVRDAFLILFGARYGGSTAGGIHLVPLYPGNCTGSVQVMHLSELGKRVGWRRPNDARTSPGCEGHHKDIDGKEGGNGPWYVALSWQEKHRLREHLVNVGETAWRALSDEQRAHWDEIGLATYRSFLRARRAVA